MKKLFTKIVGISLGIAMAIGVGVGVAANNKEAKAVFAATSANWVAHTGALTAGTEYLIVKVGGSYCMAPTGAANTESNPYSQEAFNNTTAPSSGFIFEDSGNQNGTFKIKDTTGATDVYVYSTNNNNGLRASASPNNGNIWSVTEQATPGEYIVANNLASPRQISAYQTQDWRSYQSNSGNKTNVLIYEKVQAKTPASLALSGTYPTSFYQGDEFSHEGLTATVTYANGGGTANVTASAVFSGYNMSSIGNQTVTVSYSENETTVSATYGIEVLAPRTMQSIQLHGAIIKDQYYVGDSWDLDGLDIQVNWSSGEPTFVDLDDPSVVYQCDPLTATNTSIDSFDIEVLYESFDETFTVDGITVIEHPFEDAITYAKTAGIRGSNTSSWGTPGDVTDYTGASYHVYSMGVGDNSSAVRWNSSGYLYSTVAPTGAKLKSVSIASITSGKSINVYAQNSAYNDVPTDARLTSLNSDSLSYDFTSNYKFIALKGTASSTEVGTITIEYEEIVPETQIITASAESAYSNETITVSSDATEDVTWSIVTDSGTTASGAAVTSAGVISVTGPGTVTVKAVADFYSDATKQVTFTAPPANTFEVTFNSNGGSESPAAKNIGDGDTFTFPSAGTKEHYTFDGWTSTGSEPYYAVGATSPAVVANITYSAHWTEDAKFAVTYSAGANGSGSYVHSNNYGGAYTLLAFNNLTGVSAADGYRFKDYTVGGVHKNPGETFTLSAATAVTVNFELIPLEYTVTFGTADASGQLSDFSNSSFVIPSGVTLDNIQGNAYSNNSNQAAAIRFGKSGATGSFDATIDSQYYIKRVVANLKYYGSDTTAKFAVTPDGGDAIEKTLTASFADYVYDVSSSYTNKVTLGTTINGKRAYISGFTIEYEAKTNRGTIEHTASASALKFNYEQIDASFTYTGVNIRFGGFISKTLWDQLDAESNIQGYGVMVADNSTLGGKTIKERYAAAKTNENTVEQAINSICSTYSIGKVIVNIPDDKASPATATAEQKAFMGVDSGDYYVWTVRKSIGSGFTTKYNAVAFILIDGDIVFLDEVSLSAKDIATRDVPSNPSDPDRPALIYMRDN